MFVFFSVNKLRPAEGGWAKYVKAQELRTATPRTAKGMFAGCWNNFDSDRGHDRPAIRGAVKQLLFAAGVEAEYSSLN